MQRGKLKTVFWGCGAGCVSGVMVDTRDGKIYNLPIDEQTYRNFCRSDNDKSNDETILFKPNSRLFITTSCDEYDIENTSKSKQVKEYFINVWNEPKKKFETNKSVSKTVIKKTN